VRSARLRPPRLDAVIALAAWAALVVAARFARPAAVSRRPPVLIGNAPLVGQLDLRTTWRIVAAVCARGGGRRLGPRLAAKLSWRRLLVLTGVAAFTWAIRARRLGRACARVEAARDPLRVPARRPLVDRIPDFLHTFAPLAPVYDFHVHAHPPLMLLVFWAMSKVGLGGGVAAAMVVVGMAPARRRQRW